MQDLSRCFLSNDAIISILSLSLAIHTYLYTHIVYIYICIHVHVYTYMMYVCIFIYIRILWCHICMSLPFGMLIPGHQCFEFFWHIERVATARKGFLIWRFFTVGEARGKQSWRSFQIFFVSFLLDTVWKFHEVQGRKSTKAGNDVRTFPHPPPFSGIASVPR